MAAVLWIGYRNLMRHKWLALILALSISIPLMAYLVLNAVQADLHQRYDHLSPSFLVVQKGGTLGEFYGSRLPVALGERLRDGGASFVEAQVRTVTGTTGENMILLRGVSLQTYQQVEPYQLLSGQALQPGDPPRRVMVGRSLAEKYNAYPGGTLTIRGRQFDVQAVFSTGTFSDFEAWISLADAQALLGWDDQVSIFIIPAGEVLHAGDLLDDGVIVQKMGESGLNLVNEFRQFFDILSLIAVIIGISAAVNLANALWRLAWQQRHELAVLQAVGFSRRALALYIGLQGAAVTLAGYVFGVLEGLLIVRVSHLDTAGISILPQIDARALMLSLVLAVGILLVSTVVPVSWLSRINLTDLLRAE